MSCNETGPCNAQQKGFILKKYFPCSPFSIPVVLTGVQIPAEFTLTEQKAVGLQTMLQNRRLKILAVRSLRHDLQKDNETVIEYFNPRHCEQCLLYYSLTNTFNYVKCE